MSRSCDVLSQRSRAEMHICQRRRRGESQLWDRCSSVIFGQTLVQLLQGGRRTSTSRKSCTKVMSLRSDPGGTVEQVTAQL